LLCYGAEVISVLYARGTEKHIIQLSSVSTKSNARSATVLRTFDATA